MAENKKPAAKKATRKAPSKSVAAAKSAKATKRPAKAPAPKKASLKRSTTPKAAAARASTIKRSVPVEESPGKRIALAVAEAGLDKKAVNVEIIDVLGKVDYADYLVVMSGRSDRQVAALARGIEEDVRIKTKTRCLGVEGVQQGRWVLMDFGDVVVHIFHEDVRGYYDIESLWMDAARVPVAAQA
jgi:ribosome-associated protein